jgi:hypothetical protein
MYGIKFELEQAEAIAYFAEKKGNVCAAAELRASARKLRRAHRRAVYAEAIAAPWPICRGSRHVDEYHKCDYELRRAHREIVPVWQIAFDAGR